MAIPASSVLRAATTPRHPSRFASVGPLLRNTPDAIAGLSGGDEVSQVPGEPSCTYAAFSDPGRTSAPSLEDDRANGELLFPAAFACGSRRCRCLIPSLIAGLSASRRLGAAPAFFNNEGSSNM